MIKGLISTTTRLASALFIMSTIAACGGGGGSDSGSGFIPAPPPEGANLDVTLGDANGNTIPKNGRGDVSGNPEGALASWQKGS